MTFTAALWAWFSIWAFAPVHQGPPPPPPDDGSAATESAEDTPDLRAPTPVQLPEDRIYVGF
jgi:hypothetical protein